MIAETMFTGAETATRSSTAASRKVCVPPPEAPVQAMRAAVPDLRYEILDMIGTQRYMADDTTRDVEQSVRHVYDHVNDLMKKLTD